MEKTFVRNIGDVVWVMNEDKPCKGIISSILYCKSIDSVDFETVREFEKYYIELTPSSIILSDINHIFTTKEDLIKSL